MKGSSSNACILLAMVPGGVRSLVCYCSWHIVCGPLVDELRACVLEGNEPSGRKAAVYVSIVVWPYAFPYTQNKLFYTSTHIACCYLRGT